MVELRNVLVDKFHIPDQDTKTIFQSLDSSNNEEIHYSDFLAAMVSSRIALHDDMIQEAFKRFDTDNSGFITEDNLRQVCGGVVEGDDLTKLLAEAEFKAFLQGNTPTDAQAMAAVAVIDKELSKNG